MSEINIEQILSKKEFDGLSASTKSAIVKVSNQIENKSSMEAFKILGDFYNNTLKHENLSSADKKAIYMAITSSLDKNTKGQFDMLLSKLSKGV